MFVAKNLGCKVAGCTDRGVKHTDGRCLGFRNGVGGVRFSRFGEAPRQLARARITALPTFILLILVGILTMGVRVAEAQLIVQAITPASITNTPGATATYNVNYSWANLTQAATGAVLSITVPSPVQNSSSGNITLVNNSQVTNSYYAPSNTTINFRFVSPLPAGSAGTLQFQASTRTDGTVTNGSSATFVATFSAQGQTPATKSATLVTSGVGHNATLSQNLQGSGIITTNALVSYQISPRNNSPSLNITNWTLVDTLPSNSVYLSSSPAGLYNALAGTVTWTNGSFNVGTSPNYVVNVYLPSAYYTNNQSVINIARTTNLFLDGTSVVAASTNSVKVSLPAISFNQFSKSASSWNNQFNSPLTWSVGWQARGNDPANSLTLTDTLPPAFVPTAINPGYFDVNPTVVSIQYQTKKNSTWTSLPGSPFTTTNSSDANNKTYYLTNLHLVADLVTAVQWTYTNVGTLASVVSGTGVKPSISGSITNVDLNGNTVSSTASITNFVSLSATHGATNLNLGTTSNYVTLAVAAPLVSLSVTAASGNPCQPGQSNTWILKVNNSSSGSASLTNPAVADLLPLSLQYVPGSASGAGANLSLTNVLVTTNYNGTGRTLIKLYYSGFLAVNTAITTTIGTYVTAGVVPGTITDSLTLIGWATNQIINSSSSLVQDTQGLSGNTNAQLPTASGQLTVTASGVASSLESVKGQLDPGYLGYPSFGSSYGGGPLSFQETISNPGNVTLTNITVYDILPFVGDVGVLATNQPRGSAWQPFLTGPVSGPSGVTVYYSTNTNPYRPEIISSGPPGSVNDWTTVLPADVSSVRALKFAFDSTRVLNPLDAVQLGWTMQVPANALTNTLAYNSFAYSATPALLNTTPLISEPNKVGILAKPPMPAFLGDYVWKDINLNGLQDNGETGLNDVRVELYTAGADGIPGSPASVFQQFVLTANDPSGAPGFYEFPYLSAGNYFIKVIPPAGYAISPANQGSDGSLNSKFSPTTGYSSLISVAAGSTNLNVDAGMYVSANAAVGNYVWIDRNGDGLQNEGSIDGLNGVSVQIYRIASNTTNLYATTVTAFDNFGNPGYYHFYSVPPGNYQMKFVPPAGDTFTTPNVGGANQGNNSAPNSAGLTPVFLLTAGLVNNNLNAGIILPTGPLSVGNMVWYDPNADSRYDFFGGERGINNVVVSLYYDTGNNGVFIPGTDQLFSSTYTATVGGEPGNYLFNNLPPGNFIVVLEAVNFQPGGVLYGLTNDPAWLPASATVDNYNRGGTVGAYLASGAFTLAAGTEPTSPNANLTLDFGLTYLTNLVSVGSTVFLDSNLNGQQDSGETGITNLTVQLWRPGASGIVGGSDATLVGSTNTDFNGNYIFTNLPPTNYFVKIPNPPAKAGAVSPVVYVGNQKDLWNHGTQPGGFNTAAFSALFTVTPGAQPTNFVRSGRGATLTASLPGGAANGDMTENFGFFDSTTYVAIGDTVFADINANGVQDAGEAGIAGVGLALAQISGASSNIVAYTTTDANGHYFFDLLAPGNYSVQVLSTNFLSNGRLTNYLSSPGLGAGANADNGIDTSSPAVNGIHSGVVALALGNAPGGQAYAAPTLAPSTNANLTVQLGFTPTYSLGNRVFSDNGAGGGVLNDGIQNGTEPGIANVVLKLFAADVNGKPTGATLASTTTDALGYYRFDNLVAGNYSVVVDMVSSGTALGGLATSAGADTSFTSADDQTDHGTDLQLAAGSVLPGGIPGVAVTLGAGLPPAGEVDLGGATPTPPRGHGPSGDDNDNLVVDFGFAPAYTIAASVASVVQPIGGVGASVVNLGSQATYALLVGLPEGSISGFTLVDQIPAGMQYVSSSIVTAVLGSRGLLSSSFGGTLPTPAVSGGGASGAAVTWTFGSISVPGIVSTNLHYFVVFVTLQALNVPANLIQPVLANSASCAVTGGAAVSSAPINVSILDPASKLIFVTAPISTTVGQASGTITVQRQDQFGNPVVSEADRTVTLSSSSAGVVSFGQGNSVTISNGTSTVSFTYNDSQAGTPTIMSASSLPGSITSATQLETVGKATPSISGVASVVQTYGTATATLSGAVGAAGSIYPTNGETVAISINGVSQNAAISGASGAFTVAFPTATLPASSTPYTIAYAYAGSANFTAAATNLTTTLTVNPAALSVTANSATTPYGTAYTATGSGQTGFTSSGLVNGETIGSVTITASGGTQATSPAGTYSLTPGSATGGTFNSANYSITYVSGQLTVNQAQLTLVPNAHAGTYDGTTLSNAVYSSQLTNYAISGFLNGDTVTNTGLALGGSLAFNGDTASLVRDVGTYLLSPGTLSLTGASNYTLLFQNSATNAYVIIPKALTVAGLSASSKTADGTTVATLSGTAALLSAEPTGTGAVADGKPYTGDAVSLSGSPSGTFASAAAGPAINVSVAGLSLAGTQAGNYNLTPLNLSASITPAVLDHYTVTFSPGPYYAGVPFTTYAMANDAFGNLLNLSGTVLTNNSTSLTMSWDGENQQMFDTFANATNPANNSSAYATNNEIYAILSTNFAGVASISTLDGVAENGVVLTVRDANGITGASLAINLLPAPGAYQTVASGLWNDVTIWQTLVGGAWVPAVNPPDFTSSTITVNFGHTVTVSTDVAVDQVELYGQVVVNGGVILTVVSNSLPGLNLFGSLTNNGTMTINNGARATVSAGGDFVNGGTCLSGGANGTLQFLGGSTYEHAFTTTAGTLPTARWFPGSTCLIDGYTTDTNPPGGLNQGFANFTWNCPNQSGVISLGAQFSAVTNFTVGGTGTGAVGMGGNLVVANAATVSSGATLLCGGSVLSGGSFTLSPGGTLGIGSSAGISALGALGNIQTTNRSFSTGANYIYNGTAAQSAGTGLPATVNSLWDVNTAGPVTLARATLITTTIGLTNSGASQFSLPAGTTSTAATFQVNGVGQAVGSWGSSVSTASHKNNSYFTSTTGLLNVTAGVVASFSSLSPSQTNYYGTPTLALTGVLSAPGPIYPVIGEAFTVTINGAKQTNTFGAGGAFTVNFPTATLARNNSTPYVISYNYPGSLNLNPATDTNTVLVVQGAPLTITAIPQSKTYGTRLALGAGRIAFTSAGLQNNETISTITIIANGGTNLTDTVGGYVLVPSLPTGGTANTNNYVVNFAPGLLTVIPAALTPSVTLNNKVYDGTATPVTISTRKLTGIVGSDDVTLATSGTVTGFPSRNAGSYPAILITGLSLVGSTAPNYSLVTNTASAAASITTRPLTVTAGSNLKSYDGNTSATNVPAITSGTVMSGDTPNFTAAYSTPIGGKSKTLTPAGVMIDGNGGSNYVYTFVASHSGEIVAVASQVQLFSSSPTNGYLGALFFTATNLPLDATGNIVFKTNGVSFCTNLLASGGAVSLVTTNLPRAATNTVAAFYSGDSNYLASSASILQVVTNHAPTTIEVSYLRTAGLLLRVFWSNLATNWNDVDGDAVTVAGINLTTTNNVLLATNSLQILYPASAPNVNDRFGFMIQDGHGGTNFAYVNVVVNPFVSGQQITTTPQNPGTLTFYGHPGFTYVVQRSTNLSNPNGWVNISTNTISASGQVILVDHFQDLSGVTPVQASYRLGWQPN